MSRTVITALASALVVAALAPASPAAAQERHSLGGDRGTTVSVPPPLDVPYRQIVDPARHVPGSVSLGNTSDGHLRNSGQLADESDHHYVLPEHRHRDTHFGTDELLELVSDTGRVVFERTGNRIGVGNMSRAAGGDISWSRSHNAGRDVDLAFPMLTADGLPTEVSTLVRVDRAGVARDRTGRTFDVATAWVLVEALLTSPHAQVQWIFVYDPLKQALLQHARSIDADEDVVALASDILHQPGDSAPHDDHFHIRVFCSRDDRLEGCANWGPEWSHAHLWEDAVDARVAELLRGLSDPDPAVGVECAGLADVLVGEALAPSFAAALPHAPERTQLALMEYLAEYDEPGVSGAIVPLLESSDSDDVRDQAAWLLGYLADPTSAGPLGRLIAEGGRPLADGTPVERAAAHALRNVYAPESLPGLLARAADPDMETRAAVGRVLERVTGALPPVDPALPLGAVELEELGEFWANWAAAHADHPQAEWYAAALSQAGYSIGTWETAPLETLVRALRDEREAIRFIADRALLARTNGWTPSEGWTVDRRYRYWADRLGVR